MLILVCAKYYVFEIKNTGDITKFSELPEQPSYKAVAQGVGSTQTISRILELERRYNSKYLLEIIH